jgi:hypothetical protein
MQQHIRKAIVGNDKSVASANVKPFDETGNSENAHIGLETGQRCFIRHFQGATARHTRT